MVLQGNNLRVVTHTPLGGTRSFTVPISDVSCSGSRTGKLSHLLKIYKDYLQKASCLYKKSCTMKEIINSTFHMPWMLNENFLSLI